VSNLSDGDGPTARYVLQQNVERIIPCGAILYVDISTWAIPHPEQTRGDIPKFISTAARVPVSRHPMAPINILKFGVSSPADTSPLKKLEAAGYKAKDILGVVGKSEGKPLPPTLRP
jgi:hypothetical protein